MATALPAATDFTGASITEAQFKTALTSLRTYLADLLGTDGVEGTALTALMAPYSSTLIHDGNYTVTASDRGKVILLYNTPSVTITLPTIATAGIGVGFVFFVHNLTGGSITIARSGSDTIDNATSTTLSSLNSCAVVVMSSSQWFPIGKGAGTASESAAGIVELATTAEAAAGTDTARAVTPAGVQAAKQLSAHYGQSSTNGTQVKEITGIPSWVNRITLVSTDLSGTQSTHSVAYIELGDAGGFETNIDKSFDIGASGDNILHAELVRTPGTNSWTFKVAVYCSATATDYVYADSQTTTAATDRIRVRVINGNWDAGTVTAYYE